MDMRPYATLASVLVKRLILVADEVVTRRYIVPIASRFPAPQTPFTVS
jgi:hypothetical protein